MRTHCKINSHVIFSPLNTPFLKITSLPQLDQVPSTLMASSRDSAPGTISWAPVNSWVQDQQTGAKNQALRISVFTHHSQIWGAEKGYQNLSFQRAHSTILGGTQHRAEQRAQPWEHHWCRAKDQPGACASLMLQRLRFIWRKQSSVINSTG